MRISRKKRDLDPYSKAPLFFPTYKCFKCQLVGYFGVKASCICRSSSQFISKKVICNGVIFSSTREAFRYSQLMFCWHRLKIISHLELQPEFSLKVGDIEVANYTADFRYLTEDGVVIEEVKGRWTDVSVLRFKLFKAIYPLLRVRVIK